MSLQNDRLAIIFAVKMNGAKTNESTIKTAAPRGALLVFYNYVSVDAMFSIQYDDRGLVSGYRDCIGCIFFISQNGKLHPCDTDCEYPKEQSTSGYDLSDFRFHTYHL